MQAIVVAGLLTLSCVSLAVGLKLLLLARRSRGFPELALGTFLLLGAGLGYPLSGAAPLAGAWQGVLTLVSSIFTATATCMLYAFTLRVFRRGQRWARVGAGAGMALCALYAIGYGGTQMRASTPEELLRSTMVWGGVSLLMSIGAYAWTGIESLRQYVLHRRRLALGLSDPVVANRMLLWGLMGVTTAAVVVIDTFLLYGGSVFAREIVIPLVTSGAGLLFAACLALAFFPPAWYVEAIRRRAAPA